MLVFHLHWFSVTIERDNDFVHPWGRIILRTQLQFQRFRKITGFLIFYFFVCLGIHAVLYTSTIDLAAYRSVVKSIPGQFHEPMSYKAVEHLSANILLLNNGGDLSSLGLNNREPTLSSRLGDDKFDMHATIALLEDGRVSAAKAKLEILSVKFDRIYTKRIQILNYLMFAAIGGEALILLYMLWLSFKGRARLGDEISPLSEFNINDVSMQQPFAERLLAIVAEEERFGPNSAQISCTGFDIPDIKMSLMNIVEHIAENLVRNSIIHGGRTAEQRLLAGKPDFLSIRASFQARQNDYLLSVWDDGEGIDPHVVIASALELGLVARESIAKLPVQQGVKLIFLRGFTTRINVQSKPDDDLELATMHEMAKQQGGIFSVDNQPGVCCQFLVKFPKF